MTKKEILELLRDWEFINPKLVSDGYGEFPNGYKLTESNLRSLEQRIDEFLNQNKDE
jgi:predicted DNA-binding transcriptional regulator AlpA